VEFARCCQEASAILEERLMTEAARRARVQNSEED
jgi:hypothetical protein